MESISTVFFAKHFFQNNPKSVCALQALDDIDLEQFEPWPEQPPRVVWPACYLEAHNLKPAQKEGRSSSQDPWHVSTEYEIDIQFIRTARISHEFCYPRAELSFPKVASFSPHTSVQGRNTNWTSLQKTPTDFLAIYASCGKNVRPRQHLRR